MSECVQLLTAVAARAKPVGLDDLNARAEMLTRIDRKYLVSHSELAALMARLDGCLDVLDIDGRRVFGYSSIYFDSADLATFRAHVQRRRRRFKVRVRSYLDTGGRFVEVKYKGRYQLTAKVRTPHDEDDATLLGQTGRAFAADVIRDVYGVRLPEQLIPILQTSNRRATFAAIGDDSRMTVDVGVRFTDAERSASLRDGYALVETKSAGASTAADRILRSMKVRTTSVSKYCVGVALLRDDVPANPWHHVVRTHFQSLPEHVDPGRHRGLGLQLAG